MKSLNSMQPIECNIVIFGITGDLAYKKIIPALFKLFEKKFFKNTTRIIGIGRREISNEEYKNYIINSICNSKIQNCNLNNEIINKFIDINTYCQADYQKIEHYEHIKTHLKEVISQTNVSNILYYLATPYLDFEIIIDMLFQTSLNNLSFLKLNQNYENFLRIIIEKPYGYDLNSAKLLNQKVLKVFNENQVYRIDHYLGKETVQNIMVFRFVNGIFEPIWNQKYIESIQIKLFETIGIENRANYFDKAGIIRDVIQNHLLQVLTLLTMEPPILLDPDNIRNEKLKVLHAIRPFDIKNYKSSLIIGQYEEGIVENQLVKGYLDEKGIPANSKTETLAIIKLFIDNWRWSNVPIYLIAAKRMGKKLTEATIKFKPAPHIIFNNFCQTNEAVSNTLNIKIQPDECISLNIFCKRPGFDMSFQPVTMDFNYNLKFQPLIFEAYERLLLDALYGDATLFMRSDEIEASWKFITPIIDCIKNNNIELKKYKAGICELNFDENFNISLC